MIETKILIVLLLVVVLFIAGCVGQTKYVCPDGSTASDPKYCSICGDDKCDDMEAKGGNNPCPEDCSASARDGKIPTCGINQVLDGNYNCVYIGSGGTE